VCGVQRVVDAFDELADGVGRRVGNQAGVEELEKYGRFDMVEDVVEAEEKKIRK
jgi:hypothetical protein